jgi:hypothetical protein
MCQKSQIWQSRPLPWLHLHPCNPQFKQACYKCMRTKGEIQVICFLFFFLLKTRSTGQEEIGKKNLNPLSLTSYKKEIGDLRFVPSIGNIEKAMRVFNCLSTGLFWEVLKISAILIKYPSYF